METTEGRTKETTIKTPPFPKIAISICPFYKQSGPTFAYCETSESKTSAVKWLKKFDHEMTGYKDENVVIPVSWSRSSRGKLGTFAQSAGG